MKRVNITSEAEFPDKSLLHYLDTGTDKTPAAPPGGGRNNACEERAADSASSFSFLVLVRTSAFGAICWWRCCFICEKSFYSVSAAHIS